jgi:hypothetical protein
MQLAPMLYYLLLDDHGCALVDLLVVENDVDLLIILKNFYSHETQKKIHSIDIYRS